MIDFIVHEDLFPDVKRDAGWYSDNLPKDMKDWLYKNIGKPIYSDFTKSHRRGWCVIAIREKYIFRLWTKEITALEFKLRWL